MQKLLLSTAILAASALTASAQDLFRGEAAPDEIRASDLMGMRIYASEAAVEGDEIAGLQEGWEDIGEINDIILSRDGAVDAVLVDIGGFLGIGERQVALSMASLRMISDSDTPDDVNDYFLVVNADRATLEGAPDYMAGAMGEDAAAMSADQATAVEESSAEAAAAGTTPTDEVVTETTDTGMATEEGMTEGEMEAADTADAAAAVTTTDETATTDEAMAAAPADDAAMTDDAMATADATATDDAAMADDTMAADATADAAARTPFSREGYVALGAEMMTAEALQGAAVYDAADTRVGEVGEILIDESGAVSDLVIDVGGFLGIGEKPIALPLGSVDILQQDGGDDLRIYVSQTEDELEAMETYAAQ